MTLTTTCNQINGSLVLKTGLLSACGTDILININIDTIKVYPLSFAHFYPSFVSEVFYSDGLASLNSGFSDNNSLDDNGDTTNGSGEPVFFQIFREALMILITIFQ